jgi:hypothetical protein
LPRDNRINLKYYKIRAFFQRDREKYERGGYEDLNVIIGRE